MDNNPEKDIETYNNSEYQLNKNIVEDIIPDKGDKNKFMVSNELSMNKIEGYLNERSIQNTISRQYSIATTDETIYTQNNDINHGYTTNDRSSINATSQFNHQVEDRPQFNNSSVTSNLEYYDMNRNNTWNVNYVAQMDYRNTPNEYKTFNNNGGNEMNYSNEYNPSSTTADYQQNYYYHHHQNLVPTSSECSLNNPSMIPQYGMATQLNGPPNYVYNNQGMMVAQNTLPPNQMNNLMNDFNNWMISYKTWMEDHMRDQERMSAKRSHHSKSRRKRSKESTNSKYKGSYMGSTKNLLTKTSMNESFVKTPAKQRRREHPYFEYQRCISTIENISGNLNVVCYNFSNNHLNRCVYIYENMLQLQYNSDYPGPLSKTTNNKTLANFISRKIELVFSTYTDKEIIVLWKLMYNLVKNKGVIDYSELVELFISKNDLINILNNYFCNNSLVCSPNLHTTTLWELFDGSQVNNDDLKNIIEICIKNKQWPLAFSFCRQNNSLYNFVLSNFIVDLGPLNPITTLICFFNGLKIPFLSIDSNDFLTNYRSHLSVILTNAHTNIEFANSLFESFGERFHSLDMIFTAQFCYLLAGIMPNMSDNLAKFTLIGFPDLSSVSSEIYEDSIILTEIFEYTKQFNDQKFTLISLLPLKFTVANILFDNGFIEKAYSYCEHLGKCLETHCSNYSKKFIYDVFKFSENLFLYLSSNLFITDKQPSWLISLYNNVKSNFQLSNETFLPSMDSSKLYEQTKIITECKDYNQIRGINNQVIDTIIPPSNDIDGQPATRRSSVFNAGGVSNKHAQFGDANDFTNQFIQSNAFLTNANIDKPEQKLPYEFMTDKYEPEQPIESPVMFYKASNQQSINIHPPPPTPLLNQKIDRMTSVTNTLDQAPVAIKDETQLTQSLNKMNINTKPTCSNILQTNNSNETKDLNREKSAQSSGVFVNLFSKLLPNKNKVFLPDDSEPSHVFDNVSQKWINREKDPGDNDKDYSEAPPIIPLSGNHSNNLQDVTYSSERPLLPTTTIPLSRDRLKNRYVPPNI